MTVDNPHGESPARLGDPPARLGEPPVRLGYEEAKAELLAIVGRLESGSLPLEESLRQWEQAESLARHCQTLLDGARARVERTLADNAGSDVTTTDASTTDASTTDNAASDVKGEPAL